jgi:hypothetical protein
MPPRPTSKPAAKSEVVTNCDHLGRLKFSRTLPFTFTEDGALMAANLLNSPKAVRMSLYGVPAFFQLAIDWSSWSKAVAFHAETEVS